jgi:uroporphyrinogen III methyltransferase / synthase
MLEPDLSDTSMPAMVWLVGAGPGDPGLLTLRGRRCLEEAGVIVYDALVNPLILEWARPEAERICAGKRAGAHSLKQSEINELLADCAESGRRVCRLKGGDPFIFGRGGEEALYLRERGIPFEVVPGVTSAVAGPAYAGIPVTHRGISSELRIVTGHETPEKQEALVDWEGLSQATQATLVFLMAKLNLEGIAARLMRGAWSGETPAAVIAQATLPAQETVRAPLREIAEAARHLPRPALLVVGEAVRLRETLAWFERKPLFGRRIVITRARRESVALAETLIDLGAEAIVAPMLEMHPPLDPNALDAEIAEIAKIDWIVFTSVAGVRYFFDALDRFGWDARALASCLVAAVGPATASALQARGIRPDLIPDRYETAALLEMFSTRDRVKGKRFLLPRSCLASPDLAEGLRRAGAQVREVAAYQALTGPPLDADLLDRLEQGGIDLVLFTSPSTLRHFIEAIPPDRREALRARLNAAAIGPVTAKALKTLDIAPRLIADTFTGPGLIDAVCRYFTENPGFQEH